MIFPLSKTRPGQTNVQSSVKTTWEENKNKKKQLLMFLTVLRGMQLFPIDYTSVNNQSRLSMQEVAFTFFSSFIFFVEVFRNKRLLILAYLPFILIFPSRSTLNASCTPAQSSARRWTFQPAK